MSEKVCIQDDFGNQIPLLDDYGNLSMQVIMLYTEDKLKTEDRKVVDDFVASDEMSRDALEGFALTSNASRTRHVVNELNADIQKRSGARAISPLMPKEESKFNYQRLAAAVALLVVIGGATFLLSRVWNQNQLADNQQEQETVEPKKTAAPLEAEPARELMDSALTEDAAQDKTLVDEVAEEQRIPTEAATKRFEEPNKAVVKEKKIDRELEKTIEEAVKIGTTEEAEPEMAADMKDLAADFDVSDQVTGSSNDAEMLAGNSITAASQEVQSETAAAQRSKRPAKEREESIAMSEAESAIESISEQQKTGSIAARYPGGDLKMYKFIERKKNYPDALRLQGVSGNVTITFDVDTDGRVTNAKVKNGVNGILDEDALRVVRSMPNWSPATENGTPVRTSRSVVIKYGN